MLDSSLEKVLMIGSGPIVIGQAAEFDYAGTQACKIVKNEGLDLVLANSNPATIMTDSAMADEIYLEPLTERVLERIIDKEKPDAILAGLGGQTGLNMAMKLSTSGFLAERGIRVLGTNASNIIKAEDRQLFKDTMAQINVPTIESETTEDLDEAIAIAEDIGYPVIVRPAFTLGGGGGGVAYGPEEIATVAKTGLDASPIHQILVEKYIAGWSEVEFEVIRDAAGQSVIVCSMENIDPVGVHTGDSIVVAPAQTLPADDLQMLRQASVDIVNALEVQGGCNCQYAYNPETSEYYVIEINPRVSRSSALASKATGYPIAKVTTLIALGYTLDEITFDADAPGTALTEPELDYVVVKFPRWPFDKFTNTSRLLGTQMKATGEVMSIGSSIEEGLMKAVRGLEIKQDTLHRAPESDAPVAQRLHVVDDARLYTAFEALGAGMSVDEVVDVTKIHPFFVGKLQNLVDFEASIKDGMTPEQYLQGKRLGYLDSSLEELSGTKLGLRADADYVAVDTCQGAFGPSAYYYSSFDNVTVDDLVPVDAPATSVPEAGDVAAGSASSGDKKGKILVLGSGPIRIGQGIEFDYSSVKCVEVLRDLDYDVVIINNNPETVSTDYDTADRLYFEPVTEEDVMQVVRRENVDGVVVAFGGQTAIKLAEFLDGQGVQILGTSAEGIDIAEDREKFDAFLEKLGLERPRAVSVNTLEEARIAAKILGYPVLLRPSYVIGGQGMSVARSPEDLETFMNTILESKISNSVLVDKYMPGCELEVDCISDGNTVLIPGIMQHIERAGVHSGDSIAVYPPNTMTDSIRKRVEDVSVRLAKALGTRGIVNVQYLVLDNELYVIEVNPRASRTVPYISKVTGIPMVELASRIMLGESLADMGYTDGIAPVAKYYAVKVPVFSFEKIADANSILGPEMKSTGEVLGIGRTPSEALFKGLTAAGTDVRAKSGGEGILISVEDYDHTDAIRLAEKFTDLGMKLYGTPDTAAAIRARGLDITTVRNVWENDDIYNLIDNGDVNYIVYTGALMDYSVGDFRLLHRRAMKEAIPVMTSIDTAVALADVVGSHYTQDNMTLININA
ncbi:MAG: carbamoyl-phosphate synthase large subunit [Actinomycetaceae bacterium]|nr:carbamoyl-phosphate synthase large subunit [Actinomycetaceae bacterium]